MVNDLLTASGISGLKVGDSFTMAGVYQPRKWWMFWKFWEKKKLKRLSIVSVNPRYVEYR